jgi:hypothetical protein
MVMRMHGMHAHAGQKSHTAIYSNCGKAQAKPHTTQGALVVPQGVGTVYGGLAGCEAVASRVPHPHTPHPIQGCVPG